MPGLNGIEATREILRANPRVGVLMLTMFEDDDSVFAAMRAGARGYLLKDSGGEGVVHAIRAVTSGEAVFGPGVAERIIGFFSVPRSAQRAFPELTEREEEILVPRRAGQEQPGDSRPALREREDGQKPRLQHPAQVAGGRQGAGRHPRPRRGDRR